MYITKVPEIIKPIFNQFTWSVSTIEKIIYLTFDDGPHPVITPLVLEILEQYNAKATFFCVGNNIEKNPHTFQQLLEKGHAVGNHTLNHENGWKSSNTSYFRSILNTQKKHKFRLFRPPYGKITRHQASCLKKKFELVMWDVLSGDFDAARKPEDCLSAVMEGIHPGAIVVFHDSEKAQENMLYTLPRALEYLSKQGYQFHALHQRINSKMV